MDDTAKYLIHADLTADGVVERSDVVGAVFGQTEGLLGEELDLRELQQSSKVGRIDVVVESRKGRSTGEITIATSLDKVETATLAAALETITRIGPCRATVEISDIEDVRAAKRRAVVERAKDLLIDSFDDSVMSSEEILTKVREHVRVEDITEYEGLPAGPNVADSDAIVVVEGRADVLTLLRYGIKNAIAVEGTNVPDAVAKLSQDRTVTAFLDGDRGGDLVLRELAQVGDVDYVAVAPSGASVEDLSHHEVFEALREKVPYESVDESEGAVAATDGSASPAPDPSDADPEDASGADYGFSGSTPGTAIGGGESPASPSTPEGDTGSTVEDEHDADETATDRSGSSSGSETEDTPDSADEAGTDDESGTDEDAGAESETATLHGQVRSVVTEETDRVRLLDEEFRTLAEADAADAFDAIADAEPVPAAVVLDGELTQRILDVAAQRGVGQVVARSLGEFTKQPTGVRIRTASRLLGESANHA